MGLLKKITNRVLGTKSTSKDKSKEKQALLRRCYFEVMEQRRVLSANPVIAGVTYLEGDAGQDTTPDHFEVTFQGGAETTQLTQFTINGDQDLSGDLSDGDMFFDVNDQLPGTGGYHGFVFDAANSSGVAESDIRSFSISDDGLLLTVDVDNFEAGDRLAFTIDVDEVERFRVDKIASGVEFEGSLFNAQFVDQHYTFEDRTVGLDVTLEDGYVQPQQEGIFYDEYDQLLTLGSQISSDTLDLNGDNETGHADRTAGAIDAYDLVAKPVSISGTIYHDENLNCELDANEHGISGVTVQLQKLNETTGSYENVASTTTDADGNYEFGTDLNLKPGKFKLVEVQPDGYLDVSASSGSHGGNVTENIGGDINVIADINIPLGGTAATDYDFKEVRPATLAGNVWHDQNNDGVFDSNEQGIANVLIQVTRVGAKSGVADDPFAGTDPIFVRTDANGHYSVDSLPPGLYEVVEINNYPPGEVDPLAGYIDGKDSTGNIAGTTVGTKANDRFSQVELCADDDGVEFNFGELKPAQIGGYVSVTTPEGDCLDPTDPNHVGIEGVSIELYDVDGNLVASTQTDADGHYGFDNLLPGTYTVVEIQPSGYLDADQTLGTVDGVAQGLQVENDKFTNVVLTSGDEGVNYNFCEHIPAELSGIVWHDSNDNGVIDAGEDRIGGVVIELFDKEGNKISETVTDAQGKYLFENLLAGEYLIQETQPATFLDGQESLGQIGGLDAGEMSEDAFCVKLNNGDKGVEYNFGELKPTSISGTVHGDANGDCVFNAADGDIPLAGVQLILLDSNGDEVARTVTDQNGDYSFDNLRPGTYSIREITPDGYLDGGEFVGQVGGVTHGQGTDDLISGIIVTSGEQAVNYDFCEHIPAHLCGTVYHDRNNNGVQDAGEEGIEGTRMVLTDANGNIIAETFTDADGAYCFKDLIPGTYCVKESQPDGFVDGIDTVGSHGGTAKGNRTNDQFCNINLVGGDSATDYNFGELKLAEISGFVHTDRDGNCVFDASAGEVPLEGVQLELLDANGTVIATTQTDANGNYAFAGLLPGEYSVRQVQPETYFTGGETVGSGGGLASENLIENILVESGQKLVNYDFCEVEAAEIHGRVWEDGPAFETVDGMVPEGYRELRDGIYQEGVDTPLAGVKMELYYYIDPTNGSLTPRPVTLGEVDPEHYAHMGTSDPNAPLWVETMDNGEYWFMGLPAGNYIVLETQPEGYADSNDTPGTTTGFSYNSLEATQSAPQSVLFLLSESQIMDSVVNIQVNAGGISQLNNFSEVRAVAQPVIPPPLPPVIPPVIPPAPPTPTPHPTPPSAGLTGLPGLYGAQPGAYSQFIGTSRGASFQTQATPSQPYTWHLSVVNGGLPRGTDDGVQDNAVWQQASYISSADWMRFDMDDAVWSFTETDQATDEIIQTAKNIRFGMLGGIPLSGDFDGDGTDEVAVFKDGYWMIDLNRNGRWDESDLLAKLGDSEDRPVVGDWDGDGKDDIGIYGPIWARDREAIARDPGLPNPDNSPHTRPKNVPPTDSDATNGARIMKLTSYGNQRRDVVDHVFGVGDGEVTPVAGDWNGNGIRSIGTFEDGHWNLDINGDGRFDYEDTTTRFGQRGDQPVVGDFNGDGIEEIAVYRSGTWIIDTNGNRELDATDKTFEMGGASDKPVVGDWDGDGVDEPGLYSDGQDRVL